MNKNNDFFYSQRIESREIAEIEEQRAGASPPLELRRTTAMPLHSPSDRITGKLNFFCDIMKSILRFWLQN